MSSSLSNLSGTLLESSTSPTPAVPRVYQWFSALTIVARRHFSGESGGRLLLYSPLNAEGAAIALAGNIAGAATLGVDGDAARLKRGIRHGYCDFLVNNLDEALRILKNEVRKKQPVSVCLEGDFASELREMVERGVQPDLLALDGQYEQTAVFVDRGAVLLVAEKAGLDSSVGIRWTAASAPALWLPKVDALAASIFSEGDERLRWLKLAPRYLGRAMAASHYVQMTPEEAARFEARVAEAVTSGTIGVPISVEAEATT
jgi:urocanate hydratase